MIAFATVNISCLLYGTGTLRLLDRGGLAEYYFSASQATLVIPLSLTYCHGSVTLRPHLAMGLPFLLLHNLFSNYGRSIAIKIKKCVNWFPFLKLISKRQLASKLVVGNQSQGK